MYTDGGRFTLYIRSLPDQNRPTLAFCADVPDPAMAATLIRAIVARDMLSPHTSVDYDKLTPECRKLMAQLRLECNRHSQNKAQHGMWGGPITTSLNMLVHLNQLDSNTLQRIAAHCTRLAKALEKEAPDEELAAALGSIKVENYHSFDRGSSMQLISGAEVVRLNNGSIWSIYPVRGPNGYELKYLRLDKEKSCRTL